MKLTNENSSETPLITWSSMLFNWSFIKNIHPFIKCRKKSGKNLNVWFFAYIHQVLSFKLSRTNHLGRLYLCSINQNYLRRIFRISLHAIFLMTCSNLNLAGPSYFSQFGSCGNLDASLFEKYGHSARIRDKDDGKYLITSYGFSTSQVYFFPNLLPFEIYHKYNFFHMKEGLFCFI